jgi:hypothetical protein
MSDIMGAVDIITSAAATTEDAASRGAEAAAAAGAPLTGALASGGVAAGYAGAAAGAAAEAVAEAAVPTAAAAATLPGLTVMVQLRNLGLVLPTTSSSTSALYATVDHLMVSLPGMHRCRWGRPCLLVELHCLVGWFISHPHACCGTSRFPNRQPSVLTCLCPARPPCLPASCALAACRRHRAGDGAGRLRAAPGQGNDG